MTINNDKKYIKYYFGYTYMVELIINFYWYKK